MSWWDGAGYACQFVGLAIAIWGVATSYRTLVGTPLASDIVRRAWRWTKARVFRRRQSATATGEAVGAFAVTGRAMGYARPNEPPTDAPLDVQINYLRIAVDKLYGGLETAFEVVAEGDRRIQRDLDERSSDAERRIEVVRSRLAVVEEGIAGRDGRGLRWTAAGLAITLLGVGLQWFGAAQDDDATRECAAVVQCV